MARGARQRSDSGYMHLITRGIGRQALFEEREDYLFYLSILERYSRETEVVIVAYCLMENHVHLLAVDVKGHVSLLMKKLGVSYSGYYNRKYQRQGHLFQDRFLSEAIEEDGYLLTVFRYILNNPEKAGICPAAAYEWSSYRLYGQDSALTNTSLVRAMLGDEDRYRDFIATPNEDECLEYTGNCRDDDWARAVIQRQLGEESGTALQAVNRDARNKALRKLLNAGMSVRQIERLTGISRGIVQRAKT